jgi:hypothetical protein
MGSVGGLLLQVDKLGLAIQFLPAGAVALVALLAVSVVSKRPYHGSTILRTRRRTVTGSGTFQSSRPWVLRSYPIALATIRAYEPRQPETRFDR